MSRLVDEAVVAHSRWQAAQPEGGAYPVVRVTLVSRETFYFNGLAVAPSLQSPDVAVMSSPGLGNSTLVVRDSDIFLIEVQPLGA